MTEQDGLFDNPPPPVKCGHANCKREITWCSAGQFGDWRWIHDDTNQAQCFPSGTQWAVPATDTMCSRCDKPIPRSYCWDGCRIMGQCPVGFLARDIAEGRAPATVVVNSEGQPIYDEDRRRRMNAELTEPPSDAVAARATTCEHCPHPPHGYPSRCSDPYCLCVSGRVPPPASEAHARASDPVTSHEAAGSLKSEELRRSQLGVLAMFQRFGAMHDQRLIEVYQRRAAEGHPAQSESGIRTRRKELVEQGVLEDSGEKVVLPSGRKSIVWKMLRP